MGASPRKPVSRADRRTWHYWLLLAATSTVSTIGLSSALFALAYGRNGSIWPWQHTEITLLAAISSVLLMLVVYLTYQQRNHMRYVRSTNVNMDIQDAEKSWAEKRLFLLKDTMDNVSHEFRTPLTIIKEYASAASDNLQEDGDPETHEFLGVIISSVDDLTLMVNDMIDISRIEKNILRMSRRRCRVEDIVRAVRRALERKAINSEVRFEVTLNDNLPAVYCDAEKVGRIIVNLAVNAIKTSGCGGKVRLWARAEPATSQVRIGVSDSGPGLPQEQLSSLFAQFEQQHGDSRANVEGFGLGLSVACELVALNLGDMNVEGAPGQGNAFSFTIPTTEPSTLLAHYLRRAERLRQPAENIALLSISTAAETDPTQWADAEWFLETQVRRTDLLVKTPQQDWLLVATADIEGAMLLIKRLEAAHKEVNRTRSDEELPTIRFKLLGTWRPRGQSSELAANFEAAYHTPSLLQH